MLRCSHVASLIVLSFRLTSSAKAGGKGCKGKPIQLWEIQQTLGRGDFVEVNTREKYDLLKRTINDITLTTVILLFLNSGYFHFSNLVLLSKDEFQTF